MPDEIWKDIAGYEGPYQVSDRRRIRSLNYRGTGKTHLLIPGVAAGYLQVSLCKSGIVRSFKVPRLVAQAFVPNPDNKPEVNHIDGDKENNERSNLEWCTGSENRSHAHRSGLRDRVGRLLSKKVYSPELDIEFSSAREAYRQTGVAYRSISRCCRGSLKSIGKHPQTKEKLTWRFIK